LTANEVWERAVDLGLDKKPNSKGKNPWATQVFDDIEFEKHIKNKGVIK
jgi:hypothetical protein